MRTRESISLFYPIYISVFDKYQSNKGMAWRFFCYTQILMILGTTNHPSRLVYYLLKRRLIATSERLQRTEVAKLSFCFPLNSSVNSFAINMLKFCIILKQFSVLYQIP